MELENLPTRERRRLRRSLEDSEVRSNSDWKLPCERYESREPNHDDCWWLKHNSLEIWVLLVEFPMSMVDCSCRKWKSENWMLRVSIVPVTLEANHGWTSVRQEHFETIKTSIVLWNQSYPSDSIDELDQHVWDRHSAELQSRSVEPS